MNNSIYYLLCIIFFNNIDTLKSQDDRTINIKIECQDMSLKNFLKSNYFEVLGDKFKLKFVEKESSLIINISKSENDWTVNVKSNQLPHSIPKKITFLTKKFDKPTIIEKSSVLILGMLLDADNSIYSNITTFDEELLSYLPDTARERHAHHYFCITRKNKSNEFFRNHFPNHHCDESETEVKSDCYWDNLKNQFQNIPDEPKSIGIKHGVNLNLEYLSKCLPKDIKTIYLIGKWDTTTSSIHKLKNIKKCENINCIYIVRKDEGRDNADNHRADTLVEKLIKLMGEKPVTIKPNDTHKF